MRKLIRGIVTFRETVRPDYRETFAQLALGQSPDTLFIACSDSRVVPNLFASADPGDLFVVRNIGNLVASCEKENVPSVSESVGAAIEFAVLNLRVTDIIVCGHSECGAMAAIAKGLNQVVPGHLRSWLRHGPQALQCPHPLLHEDPSMKPHNQLSRQNVLLQLEHLRTYPIIQERMKHGHLRIHGWWFDIANADVYGYEADEKRFVLIDQKQAERLLKRLDQ